VHSIAGWCFVSVITLHLEAEVPAQPSPRHPPCPTPFLQWTLLIQTMELADQDKFDFDPLDVTKIWPENLFPLQPVGRMVLNKNIDNFFNENEQLAFCPALVVPGGAQGLLGCWLHQLFLRWPLDHASLCSARCRQA
jgi:hypothetical protein